MRKQGFIGFSHCILYIPSVWNAPSCKYISLDFLERFCKPLVGAENNEIGPPSMAETWHGLWDFSILRGWDLREIIKKGIASVDDPIITSLERELNDQMIHKWQSGNVSFCFKGISEFIYDDDDDKEGILEFIIICSCNWLISRVRTPGKRANIDNICIRPI